MNPMTLTIRIGKGDRERLREVAGAAGQTLAIAAAKLLARALRGGNIQGTKSFGLQLRGGESLARLETTGKFVEAGAASAKTREYDVVSAMRDLVKNSPDMNDRPDAIPYAYFPKPPPEPPLKPWHIEGPLLKEFMAQKMRHPWSEEEWASWKRLR